ncbi:MAG: DUF1330 domain-containing protein [Pseudooceanicola sp.]|nr:DUF1330 domain-containing protein [Pseudooceanicola sp.]
MAKGYWVGHVDVADLEEYKKYIAANAAPLAEYGARFLVRGGEYEQMEGSVRKRTVVIEFDSYETALACYNSPGYQAALALRKPVSTGDMIVIKGYDG